MDYYINSEKGIVTAVMTDTSDDAISFVDSFTNKKNGGFLTLCIPHIYKRYQMPDKFVGTAKCAPEDEFDEDYGIRLARKRCLSQYRKVRYQVIKRMMKEIRDCVNEAERIAGKVAK